MYNKMRKVLWIVATVTAVAVACSSSPEGEEKQEETEVVTQTKEKKDKAQVREISELAGIMLTMHDQLKAIRGHVERGEAIPDSLNWDFENMKTAEATKDMNIDEGFDGMATAFLAQLKVAMEDQSVESYNEAVTSCVNCHNSYCPGPIARIKKLKI